MITGMFKIHFTLLLFPIMLLSSCLVTEDDIIVKPVTEGSVTEYPIDSHFDFDGTIAQWFQFKEAASSVTLDDGTYDQYAAAFPLLEELNIKGTFYLAASLLDKGSWSDNGTLRKMMNWEQAAEIAASGHEIGSHTYSHIDMSGENVDIEFELHHSRDYIQSKLPGVTVETFCWPHWRETDEALEEASKYYISARSGNGIISYYIKRKGGIPSDPPENMYKINSLGFLNNQTDEEWKELIDSVYDSRSWFVSSYHGVDNGQLPADSLGWSHLTAERFAETIRYPLDKGFWMDTFANVSKYIIERDRATLHIKNSSLSIHLTLDDQLDDRIYNQKLSISFKKPDHWDIVSVMDETDTSIAYREIDKRIFLDIFPDGKQIEIKPLLTREK
jgi:peptidoglycan/xylan/chitin deacetylase (PgdA/CDA1 family)